MEGQADGALNTHFQATAASSTELVSISNALQATLHPHTSSNVRQDALNFLEQLKLQPNAPSYGFTLAHDYNQPTEVRYYGLQLLEYSIRYRWADYREEHREQIREWVKQLAGSIRPQDLLFVRNKIAQLWVEVAKRCWGDQWMDMDELLVKLWTVEAAEKMAVNAIFVLYVLQMLSEDICNSEDSKAGLRLDVLGHALNEIMIPQALYQQHVETREQSLQVRAGQEGWLSRICGFFTTCLREARMGSAEVAKEVSTCAIKALNAMRPTMAWISLQAIVEADCIDCLLLAFHTDDTLLQTAAIEVLYAVLVRPYNSHFHEVWLELVHQAMRPDRVGLMKHAYGNADSAPGEDSEKYLLQKKISELLSLLAAALAAHPELTKMKVDIPNFFALLVQVLESKSLVVSIPVLHSWTKLLVTHDQPLAAIVMHAIATLLQLCNERLIRYEALPEDSDDATVQFLNVDFETVPERHAFLGNYRRYCVRSIEIIAQSRPMEALAHVLDRMMDTLSCGAYTAQQGFDMRNYSKSSIAALQFDAQFQVVTSALKGFTHKIAETDALSADDPARLQSEGERDAVVEMLQNFCQRFATAPVDDPEVAIQQLQLLVIITRTLKPRSDFVLSVVQHILNLRLQDHQSRKHYSDGVKEFEAIRVTELQKLALVFPTELFQVYTELEPRVATLAEVHKDDSRLVWGYRAFLFMVVHRGEGVHRADRMAKLQEMIKPVYDSWRDGKLTSSVESLWTFLDSLSLGQLPDFFAAHRFDKIRDWSAQELDFAGKLRQKEIETKCAALPFRATKALLAASVERLREATDEFDVACALWSDVIPVILPTLLAIIRHATAFNNVSNWSQLPDELQVVIKKTLQDRFWQAGISNESKDDFYARISSSKSSYEGFASTVRGTPRAIREQGYNILYLLTKFEEQFYSLPDFAGPLADALFADADALSTNHLHGLLNLAQQLVSRCPPHYRARFLPPLLIRLFVKFDSKISGEWDAIAQRTQQAVEDDELSEEMRRESVLRQLTHATVAFVPFLLEHGKSTAPSTGTNGHSASPSKPSLGDLILSDASLLEPLMLLCTHALRMHDSRSCSVVCRVFRSIIPVFVSNKAPAPQVREFIAKQVLEACITSLNEEYFADLQKELASLVAQIVMFYASATTTVRMVLLSLPQMSAAKVDKAVDKVQNTQNDRQQRAIILDLLEGVRSVSVHEQGKIAPQVARRKDKSAVQAQYMEMEEKPAIVEGDETGLDGVAGMFGDG